MGHTSPPNFSGSIPPPPPAPPGPSDIAQFSNRTCYQKHLKDLRLARKYARIFVLGHYLFLEARSFPRAKLSENYSLLGTAIVRGQISEHISTPNGSYCLCIWEWPLPSTGIDPAETCRWAQLTIYVINRGGTPRSKGREVEKCIDYSCSAQSVVEP